MVISEPGLTPRTQLAVTFLESVFRADGDALFRAALVKQAFALADLVLQEEADHLDRERAKDELRFQLETVPKSE